MGKAVINGKFANHGAKTPRGVTWASASAEKQLHKSVSRYSSSTRNVIQDGSECPDFQFGVVRNGDVVFRMIVYGDARQSDVAAFLSCNDASLSCQQPDQLFAG